ncbi:hypothetical protein F5883DRAFT_718442 [Diaporthe sp. PMI_573]|nr:hypothetical protein F5883DRAFT_718442 [Diaporthaceae sp. PMI_573]
MLRARRCNSYSSVRPADRHHASLQAQVRSGMPDARTHYPVFTPQTAAVVLEICRRAPSRLPPRALGCGIILCICLIRELQGASCTCRPGYDSLVP